MHTECLSASALAVLKRFKDIAAEREFVLAGGTAAALRLGHRRSVDFDFFTRKSFSNAKVFQAIIRLDVQVDTLQDEPGTLTITVDKVKISIFHYPYQFMEKLHVVFGISVAGLIDIASMKILAINQRGAKRDFVDLYFILQQIPFLRVAENMLARFGAERINPVVIGKALVYFADADPDPEPEYLGKKKDWRSIKRFFTDHVQQFVLDLHKTKARIGEVEGGL